MKNQGNNVTLPEWILLLPLGRVELVDRPEPLQVDPESLAAMVQAFRSRGVDLVIDYEHQSLQGRQAPAAGWIKDLEARGDGLWARVEWTAQAREYLHNREYRYFSPVLQLDPESRKPKALMQVGLTNVPAIKRLPPLVAKWEAVGPGPGRAMALKQPDAGPAAPAADSQAPSPGTGQEGAEIKSFLELSPEAEDQAVWAGVLELIHNLVASLELPAGATAAQALAAVESLKQEVQRLTGVEGELKNLQSSQAAESTARAVDEAMKAGKIAPAQRAWALEYYRQDPGGFQTFVARAPQLVPCGRELQLLKEDGRGAGHLVPEELSLCKSLNLDPEKYLQAKARSDRVH